MIAAAAGVAARPGTRSWPACAAYHASMMRKPSSATRPSSCMAFSMRHVSRANCTECMCTSSYLPPWAAARSSFAFHFLFEFLYSLAVRSSIVRPRELASEYAAASAKSVPRCPPSPCGMPWPRGSVSRRSALYLRLFRTNQITSLFRINSSTSPSLVETTGLPLLSNRPVITM